MARASNNDLCYSVDLDSYTLAELGDLFSKGLVTRGEVTTSRAYQEAKGSRRAFWQLYRQEMDDIEEEEVLLPAYEGEPGEVRLCRG
jgi:hypothetical protein